MEEIRGKIKAQNEPQKIRLGKRSFNTFESRQLESGSSSGPSKKLMFEKMSSQGQSSFSGRPNNSRRPRCDKCMGPHEVKDCKWKDGACFTCGQVGHKVS